jgi:putative hydrolase of the HAD superfamily
MKAELASQELVWLFDLDNTLHNASAAVFPAIANNMVAFMVRLLGDGRTPADFATANALRLAYLHRYGATLKGLINHHGVKQDEFLLDAHCFDNLHSLLKLERGLARCLTCLPGRKILFTNAPLHYSQQVLRHLRLHKHFSQHISIESMQVHGSSQPKPSKAYLRKWLAREGLRAHQCVLVEDSVANLRAAQELGLRTVLVTGFGPHTVAHKSISNSVDITVKSVFELVRSSRQFQIY